jgi:hypothetical protein
VLGKVVGKTGKMLYGMLKCYSIHVWGSVGMADEHDLGSCAARRRGSNPLFPRTGQCPSFNYLIELSQQQLKTGKGERNGL